MLVFVFIHLKEILDFLSISSGLFYVIRFLKFNYYFTIKSQYLTKTTSRFLYLISYVCVPACLHVCCMCVTCIPGALRGEKRVSDPLKLDLQRIVSCHMGVGLEPCPLQEQQVS